MGLPNYTTPMGTPQPVAPHRRASVLETSVSDMPRAFKNQRSVSCPVRGAHDAPTGERFVRTTAGVSFESEAFRLQTEAKIAYLMDTATSPVSSRTNALLARKALKYRKRDVPRDAVIHWLGERS